MAKPNVLCDTAGMTRERWLECRMHGPKGDIPYTVGGSDVATIFGLSPWTTPLELWRVKKGLMQPFEKPNLDQLEMGHLLEPIAAHFFGKKTGYTVQDDTFMYQHADFPYALADMDRIYFRPGESEESILEFKSTSYHKADAWADGKIPLYYELQLRFYMAVKDVQHGAFAAIWGNNPDNDFAYPQIERDKAKEDMIFEKLDRWNWSLVHDQPPSMEETAPALALEALAKIYKGDSSLPTIEFPVKLEQKLRRIAELQEKSRWHTSEAKKLEEEVTKHAVRIAEVMQAHEHGLLETTSEKLLIDFVTKSTTRVDSALLKKNYESVYKDVLKKTESRKLKVSIQPI